MAKIVKRFYEINEKEFQYAGGKGGTLARLIQKNFPIPNGMVIFPDAFDNNQLIPSAWQDIQKILDEFKSEKPNASFAVRSSALSEDSAYASFAGEFETVLDVHSAPAVKAAIEQVQASRDSQRVKAYSKNKGLGAVAPIAVIIQQLIRADISGILFTSDPVTRNRFEMHGNYVYGLGDELVSGEAEPFTFTFQYPAGVYHGPDELKKHAKKLFKLAIRLENELGCPQDIEWAVAHNTVYILQSRPITTLKPYNPQTAEWNHSRSGDFVWFQQEVFPDVLTPATWSIFKNFQSLDIYNIPIMGNIHGRLYMNFSLSFSMFGLLNKSREYMLEYIALVTGHSLNRVTIKNLPLTKGQLLKVMLPKMITMLPKQFLLVRKFDQIIADNPAKCEQIINEVRACQGADSLVSLYNKKIFPLFWNLLQVQDKANENYFFPYLDAKLELYKSVGKEQADHILSKMTARSGTLASVQPLIDLQRLSNGDITRKGYQHIAGHRPPHENEIAEPRLYEQPGWIEDRLNQYQKNPRDYLAMAESSKQDFEHAWSDFKEKHPRQAARIWKELEKTLLAMEKREIIRSELTRSIGVVRQWYLQCGEMLNIGNDVFFLEVEELMEVLHGNASLAAEIAKRKSAYQRQLERPVYPAIISGTFNLDEWMRDPSRRHDIYDTHTELVFEEQTDIIKGYPGSSGRVAGLVRVLHNPSDGHQLKQGEILVAASTNVGWTPIFPRAAAVITDIGAPLSHAAIIARELGIPAVVGTANGTTRLHTGDRVFVDGEKGIVLIKDAKSL